MAEHDIIVVGASAGGVEALVNITRNLPHNIPAAIFVVLHIPAEGPSLLPSILERVGQIKVVSASDGAEIQQGQMYVAPPDRHLLLERGRVRLSHGPKENRHRPAIDPLFRSAAVTYGSRVIGVVLTGSLDDGTAGLQAIKQCGGIAVVQDPTDALYQSMPESALAHVQVDHIVPISEIGQLLTRLAHEPAIEGRLRPVPENLDKETQLVKMNGDLIDKGLHPGKSSIYSCPECGGVLWEIEDGGLLRFRCHVGHAFSVESMQAEQQDALENALWVALKTLTESSSLSQRLAKQAKQRGQEWLARSFEERARESEQRASTIRGVLNEGFTEEASPGGQAI